MEKIEKYKSFQEMKASAKSIGSSNAAVVAERHKQIKQSLVSMRQDLIKHKNPPRKKLGICEMSNIWSSSR